MNEEKPNEEIVHTETPAEPQKLTINDNEENVALGTLGAIIGSLAGAAAIILLDRIGFVASVAGVAMAVCTLSLYEKFAKKISKKGIIICVIVMIIMTLLAENAACSIQIANELKEYGYNVSVTKVFMNFFSLLAAGDLETGTYIGSLVMVYLFTALGAYGQVAQKLKMAKAKETTK